MGENIYMCPSDMNLNIRSGTVRYNNKILISDEKFSLGKNDKVNPLEAWSGPQVETPETQTTNSNEVQAHTPTITHKNQKPQIITHNEENISLVLFLASGFAIWNMVR